MTASTPSHSDLDRLRELTQARIAAGDPKALDELRAYAAARVSQDHYTKYAVDPVRWVTDRLRQTVWSKQAEIMQGVITHRRTAVRSAHGVGKSHVAALIACHWLDTHPPGTAFVVTTAPTFSQVRAILWRYIRRIHKVGGLPGHVNQTEWHLADELVAIGRKPADHDEAAFQGIHARYVLVILDEAGGIPEDLWVAADALTTNADCRILAIGNPDNPASHFRKVCQPGSPWNVLGISAFDSPNLTGEAVPPDVALALVGREWVDEKTSEWGPDNPLYMSKVLGQFAPDGPHQVVRMGDVTACRLPPDVGWFGPDLVPVELGVDVGGGGDETVIRERRGVLAGREWRAHTDRPEEIAPMVLRAIHETGATSVKVDSIGIGFGVIGELRNMATRRLHDAHVQAVNVASAPADKRKYVNLRAELWWELGRNLSERRGWDLSTMDNADTTVAQLLEPRWSIDPQGRIKVEPKDDVIKRLGRSPDNADALLLAFYRSVPTAVGNPTRTGRTIDRGGLNTPGRRIDR